MDQEFRQFAFNGYSLLTNPRIRLWDVILVSLAIYFEIILRVLTKPSAFQQAESIQERIWKK